MRRGRSPCKPNMQNVMSPVKAMEGIKVHDSDVDSGIVAFGTPDHRVGSTSSAETDSSQESRHKIEYCSPLPKCDLRTNGIQLRTVRRQSGLPSQSGPIKADHTVLKECNRRPPTPLTVFPENHHSVRFDEQLQLSEQNLRRSCRRLFATLYGHRFSYPSGELGLPAPPMKKSAESSPFRTRSKTLPEEELRKHFEVLKRNSVDGKDTAEGFGKENLMRNNRKVVSWSLKQPNPAMMEQVNGSADRSLRKDFCSPGFQRKALTLSDKMYAQRKDHSCTFRTSIDSGLGLCRSKCTCQNSARNSGGSSSQSSTTSSSSTNHYAYQSPLVESKSATNDNKGALFKSNSCSTLSSMLQQLGNPISPELTEYRPPVHSPPSTNSSSVPLQKTSSCSSLIDRTSLYNVPVYNDSMVHVYAEVASVVPEEADDTSEEQFDSYGGRNNHIYDTVKSPPMSVPTPPLQMVSYPLRQDLPKYPTYQQPRRNPTSILNGRLQDYKDVRASATTKDNGIQRPGTPSGAYVSVESRHPPYRNRICRETPQTTAVAMVRPTSVTSVRPHSSIPNGYLKSALKHNSKTASQQNVAQSTTADDCRPRTEVEYAVVDKSKKNRFTRSLPTLNSFNSNGCIADEDKNEPPVPPKKHLHKSDFSLNRSRSSSPKKSFFEKVHVLTKNAKDALQKAFSTERIYRPEREERLEATGQKLLRSKSFIKGLRASISRKRRKNKTPLAEVVPQASSNPDWDEHPSGLNSPVHVRGQLLQLNLDGSQVIELSKPPNKPYGFFVARGRVRNSKGVFVSRMRDQETQKQLAGLLDIGDEILEIKGLGVKDADIMQVNDLMANKNTLLLTVLPYICRKDI